MKIDELNFDKVSRQRRIDLIREIQEYQAKLDDKAQDSQKLGAMSSNELLAELERLADRAEAAVKPAADEQARAARGEGVAAIGAAAERRSESTTAVDGTSRTAEAVDAAHKQQDRGESWEKFAKEQDGTQLPPSVEETARERQRQEAEQEERERLTARDLQNELMVQSRRIRS